MSKSSSVPDVDCPECDREIDKRGLKSHLSRTHEFDMEELPSVDEISDGITAGLSEPDESASAGSGGAWELIGAGVALWLLWRNRDQLDDAVSTRIEEARNDVRR